MSHLKNVDYDVPIVFSDMAASSGTTLRYEASSSPTRQWQTERNILYHDYGEKHRHPSKSADRDVEGASPESQVLSLALRKGRGCRPGARQKASALRGVGGQKNGEPSTEGRGSQNSPLTGQRQQEGGLVIGGRPKVKTLQREQQGDVFCVFREDDEAFPEIGLRNEDFSATLRREEKRSTANKGGGFDMVLEGKEPSNSLQCSDCGKQFRSKIDLEIHLRDKNNSEEKLFKCYFCRHSFSSRSCRSAHEKVHGERGILPCCCCDRLFYTRQSINRHRLKTEIQFPPKCPDCDMVFISKSQIQRHLRVTQMNLPYSCSVCGHKYASEMAQRRHFNTHLRKLEFECAACRARFTTENSLRKHITSRRKQRMGRTSAPF